MYKVEGTTIYLTRGDSLFLQLSLRKQRAPYTPAASDIITFALKRNALNPNRTDFVDTTPIIQKTIPNDTLLLHLAPEDTQSLGFGEYVYDIELEDANGDKDTFIADAKFVLTREVH